MSVLIKSVWSENWQRKNIDGVKGTVVEWVKTESGETGSGVGASGACFELKCWSEGNGVSGEIYKWT